MINKEIKVLLRHDIKKSSIFWVNPKLLDKFDVNIIFVYLNNWKLMVVSLKFSYMISKD